MRVGHVGFALVARRVRPRIPLWLLLVAAYGPDIVQIGLWPFRQYDTALSHSWLAVALGATLVAGSYFLARRSAADAIAIWLTYLSHWPADFVTGTKPTWPGGPQVGLMLYDRPVLSWVVELSVLAVCWWFYQDRSTRVPGPEGARLPGQP
jgi:hypothetical protein